MDKEVVARAPIGGMEELVVACTPRGGRALTGEEFDRVLRPEKMVGPLE